MRYRRRQARFSADAGTASAGGSRPPLVPTRTATFDARLATGRQESAIRAMNGFDLQQAWVVDPIFHKEDFPPGQIDSGPIGI